MPAKKRNGTARFTTIDAKNLFSAFYAGVPFGTTDSQYYTTPMVYNEIKHIKKSHDALGMLLETDRLKIKASSTVAAFVASNTSSLFLFLARF